MNKRELKKLIVQHGGTVLEEFPGPKQKIPDSVVLISDKFVAFIVSPFICCLSIAKSNSYFSVIYCWLIDNLKALKCLEDQKQLIQTANSNALYAMFSTFRK